MIRFFIFFLLVIQQGHGALEKLALPRFASLRSSKVNIHVGPSLDFPIEWTFQRQGLPVEIIAEFDTWRQIRDMQGTVGWVHKSLLIGKRTAIIINVNREKINRELRVRADPRAAVVARLEVGVIGKVKQCKNDWCRLEVKGYDGWIERKHIWGVYTNEEKF